MEAPLQPNLESHSIASGSRPELSSRSPAISTGPLGQRQVGGSLVQARLTYRRSQGVGMWTARMANYAAAVDSCRVSLGLLRGVGCISLWVNCG